MKKLVVLIVVIAMLAIGYVTIIRPPTTSEARLTFATLESKLKVGAKLYDVRTAEEYNAGHAPGATNWSLQDIESGRLPDTPKDTEIFLYCRSGNRSAQASDLLKKAGFTHVTDLGGLTDMQALGAKLVQ